MKRLQRLRRLAGLQAKLRDLEERRLADLRRRETEVEEAQHAILDALGRGTMPAGQFGAVLARQAGRLAADGAALGSRAKAQAVRLAEESARARHAERAAEAAEHEAERDEQQRALDQLVQQIAGKKDASLP